MTLIRKWSGDGVLAGTLTTSSAGTGDTPFTSVTGDVTIVSSGARSPQIRIGDAAAVKRFGWWPLHTSALTSYAVRFYVTLGGLPVSEVYLANALDAGAGVWSARVTSSGYLRLRDDAAAAVRWTATSALPVNTPLRIEIVVTNGNAVMRAYNSDTMTVLFAGSGVVGAQTDEMRFGFSTSVASTNVRYDDIAVDTTPQEIGPAGAVAEAHTHFRLLNGEWVPQTVKIL